MKRLLIVGALIGCFNVQAEEAPNSSNEPKRDAIQISLTIEKATDLTTQEWANLEKVVSDGIQECEESENNTPTFLYDAKDHITRIIEVIEKLPSYYGLFELSIKKPDLQEEL